LVLLLFACLNASLATPTGWVDKADRSLRRRSISERLPGNGLISAFYSSRQSALGKREFSALGFRRFMLNCDMGAKKSGVASVDPKDEERMAELVAFTAKTLETARPVPFGALIVNSKTGERLLRAVNAVAVENDPSSHAELRTVRLACRKLKRVSLAGHTMYTTCEPCPMCMANALWAGLDRVVFGATIADANRHCRQILIPAREVARRSDMTCVVDGPILRKECNELFTHPNMQKVFASWNPKAPANKVAKS
jgi:tRNA(Arg) A34 adenosine deaminase TadA